MTSPVTDLACMDGENMAAIALQLQLTALQAETRFYTLEQRLRAAVNRPTKIQRSTALITGLVADPFFGYQSIGPQGGGSFVTDFDNTGFSGSVDSSGRTMFGLIGTGLYEFGISANLIASGAVTDNTYRIFRIINTRQDPLAPDEVEVDQAALTLYESNTGVGVDACVTAVFRMEAADRIQFVMQHQNAGSSLNASIGTLVWMTKLSSDDAVVVT
jgi:hypothetical protein